MKVYFVRHAKSTANESRTVEQDDREVELSALGHVQAASVAERFKNISIDVILSSTYKRTRQTAEAISRVTQKEIVVTELLRERRHPSYFGGKHMHDEELLDVRRVLLENAHAKDWHHSDEENYWELITRAREVIAFIESRTEENIAVVTHAAFLKCILAVMAFGEHVEPFHFEHFYHFFLPTNTGITVCEYKVVPGTIRREPQWRLMTFNDYSHLGE